MRLGNFNGFPVLIHLSQAVTQLRTPEGMSGLHRDGPRAAGGNDSG